MKAKETYIKKVKEIGGATTIYMTEAIRLLGASKGDQMKIEVMDNNTIIISKYTG